MSKRSVIVLKAVDDGWLEIEMIPLQEAEKVVFKLPSESCEPLIDLTDSLLKINALYREDGGLPEQTKGVYTFWEANPRMYTCAFIPKDQRQIGIELSCCSDMYAGIHTHDDTKLNTDVKLDILLNNFYEEMKSLLLRYGFTGYYENWGKDFPLSIFLKLHTLVKDNKLIKHDLYSELE
ncbi:MAG: hypothetical protein WC071_13275, partial [Victivallaceae bacterium]